MCLCESEVESSQQPAEEASPLGSKEADEKVNHRGDEDDACCHVVQVVESFLIGHHVQVPAGCNNTRTHTQTDTQTHISNISNTPTYTPTYSNTIIQPQIHTQSTVQGDTVCFRGLIKLFTNL